MKLIVLFFLLKISNLNTFFDSVLRPSQDYFSSYETDQSVGGAKTEEPREKQARAGLEPTPDTAVR